MSPREIEVGKSYHNGKEGPRSYSERKVLEMGVRYFENFNGITWHDGVKFEQTQGRFKGTISMLPLSSFAKWAREEVLPEATEGGAMLLIMKEE